MKRIYHTWDEWECYPAGFYEVHPPEGMSADECRDCYADFLRDADRFRAGLEGVLTDWPNSCEHYLSNDNMNRIAWLGQAAMCHETNVSHAFRGGFNQLSPEEQADANLLALEYLNRWLVAHGEAAKTLETAKSRTQVDIY